MIRKVCFILFIIFFLNGYSNFTLGQKHYTKNPHVVYEVTSDSEYYTVNYTFKDHYDNFQTYNLKLPVVFTDNEIAAFGIPKWLFDPFIDNEQNRVIRNHEITEGLFTINDNFIEVDKSALLGRYAENFCKPIAGLIVQSLQEYKRDTRRDRIEFTIRFVQDIPYGIPDYADKEHHFGGVSPPPGVLRNGYGDCDSKVLLFAGILIYLIPVDDFIFLNQPEHVLSAIREIPDGKSTYIRYDKQDFLIAETAGPGKRLLGEEGEYFGNKFTVEPLRIITPDIFPYKNQVSSNFPYAPELPVGKNYLVIQNSSDRDFPFQLSLDNSHWKEFILHKKISGSYKFDTEISVFLKIRGKNSKTNVYKVSTGKTYKFTYNSKEKLWEPD